MNLDRILHEKKQFAELEDTDLEVFLRDRRFRMEHLNLEFKVQFPYRSGKCEIREVCRYIVGFSNEEGGVVVYGVADQIKDDTISFPDYVPGLQQHPSVEDLSQWVSERVRPLVQSPAIRLFQVQGRTIAVLKIPEGSNRPYCYYDPATKALSFFKKTAGGIKELEPDEVREIYWNGILDQSTKILRAGALKGIGPGIPAENDRLSEHRKLAVPKLENVTDFGRLGMYCLPDRDVDISMDRLKRFVIENRSNFAEAMRYYPDVEVFQKGVTTGFYPRAVRQEIKSTSRVTLYRDGLVAWDAQADTTMDRDNILQPYWLAYEIQRHLQLAKAVLKTEGVETLHVAFELENIENFAIQFSDSFRHHEVVSKYGGTHEPIQRDVPLAAIHDHDGALRNTVMPAVREIMDEVCRIFGLTGALPGVWDQNGYLYYVKGLENSR